MNLKQLERIGKKISEIRQLIAEDPVGCLRIKEVLEQLEAVVNKAIREELWDLYQTGKLKEVTDSGSE